ncbi:right-handed parallel beta-helix repeat-containing protein [Paenibacillus ginsengarvi]|uniref:Right-handed parallel beta-helix repeat-containing protein n=1 Tax=Paenibacillus ginsengarvi TaxID=400777 RepID=A0A3B0AUP7_9BACL|nr:right-handed parallel beta-helix repeat-containing protein [Paenibacillus ginsengarvi]RKN64310.1 right-handed parallel beta-helix repeat-containing protein [Paenibacillus ginsengarvi]
MTVNGLGKAGKGFDFGLLKDSVFTRMMVTGFPGGTAFRVGGGWSNFLYECYFNECGDGFVYDNGVQELNQTIWTNCQFNANDRYGAALLNSQNNGTNIGSANVFLNCDAENNGDTGIYLHTGKNTKIIGGYIEYNRKFGIRQVPGTGGVQMQGLVVSPAFVIGTKNKPGLPQDSVGVSIEYALNPVVAGQIVNCKEGLKIGYYADGCDYSGTFLGSSDTNLVDQSRSHNYDSKLLSTRGGVLKIKTGATSAADYVPASAVTDRILTNLSAPKSFDVIVKSGVGGTVPQFVEFLLCGCDDSGSNASYLEKVAVYRGSSSFWETKTTFSSDSAGSLWSIALSNKTDQSVRVTITANHPGSHAGDTANISTVSPDIYACKPVY